MARAVFDEALLRLREVDIGVPKPGIPAPQHQDQEIGDRRLVAAGDRPGELELLRRLADPVLAAGAERAAGLVDDRDVLARRPGTLDATGRRCRRPARSTARCRAGAAAAPKRSASGGCEKIGLLRHRQADLGRDHAVDLAHRPRERALDAADIMYLLDKRADPEALVVEHRPFVAVRLGDAARRELEPGAADLGGRHQDDPAALGDLVGDVELLKLGEGAAALFAGEPRIKHRISRAPRPQGDDREQREATAAAVIPTAGPRASSGPSRAITAAGKFPGSSLRARHLRPLGPARLACS